LDRLDLLDPLDSPPSRGVGNSSSAASRNRLYPRREPGTPVIRAEGRLMAGWTTRRAAAGTLGLFAVAALGWAVSVRAQPPRELPPLRGTPLPRETAEPPIAAPAGEQKLPP